MINFRTASMENIASSDDLDIPIKNSLKFGFVYVILGLLLSCGLLQLYFWIG